MYIEIEVASMIVVIYLPFWKSPRPELLKKI